MTTKTTEKQTNEEVSTLAQMRDELRVQMELGKAEAHDLWDEMEAKWEELERDTGRKLRSVGRTMEPVRDASSETAAELGSAAKLLLGEIADGYRRIRKSVDAAVRG